MGRIVLGFRHEILFAMRRCGRRLRPKILNERAAQIDVQELAAVADGQDRLFLGKGMLEDGTVSLFPRRIRGRGQPPVDRTVLPGRNVRGAAGEDKAVERRD